MTQEYLWTCVEDLHKDLHAAGATASDRERALHKLRNALTPRRADKAPTIAPAAPAAPQVMPVFGGAPLANAGAHFLSSSSSPPEPTRFGG